MVSLTLIELSLLALFIPQAAAQTVPAPADHELHRLWGGETRAVFALNLGQRQFVCLGEDGGRIRRSLDGGETWIYADTPDDYTGTVLDLWFDEIGLRGFACGRGGRVLRTTDGGATWSYYGTQVLDPCGDPATLWSVQPLNDHVIFVAGLWLFQYTPSGGETWIDVSLFADEALTMPLDMRDFHFYAVSTVGDLTGYRGAAAAEWESPTGSRGVVFHTDSEVSAAAFGRRWWLTLDDSAQPPSTTGAVMTEPWALNFHRGASSPTDAIGYVVGGPGGNHWSRWYRTPDGGATWTVDGEAPVTLYDVASEEGGPAMIVGYSGLYLTRTEDGQWVSSTLPQNNPSPPTSALFTGAIGAVHGTGPGEFYVGGSFGLERRTSDYGATWHTISPFYDDLMEEEWRLADVYFFPTAPLIGFAVGQHNRIVSTTDGGSTWSVSHIPGGQRLDAIEFRDERNGIAVGLDGRIHYTRDGGRNWFPGGIASLQAGHMDLADVSLVGAKHAVAVGTQSASPVVVQSRNFGRLWFEMNAPPEPGLRLTGVAFAHPDEGLVVGWSQADGSPPVARAYRVTFTGITATWTEASPPLFEGPSAEGRKLLAVALVGNELDDALAYAVGNGGMVLRWDGTTFVDVPEVYDLDETTGEILFRELVTDLEAVDLSPSGNHALIGGQYDIDISKADDFGWMLRLDASGWNRIRSLTSKDIRGISLTGDGEGYVLGFPHTSGTGRPEDCDDWIGDPYSSSANHGNLKDSIILRYLAN